MNRHLLYDTSQWIIYPLIVLLVIAAGKAGAPMVSIAFTSHDFALGRSGRRFRLPAWRR